MKSTVWTLVLLVLVFAIGWTSRVVAERADGRGAPGVASDDGARERRRGPRGGRGRSGRGIGRFLDSVRQFSAELELSGEQETALGALFDDTLRQVHEHERKIWEVTHDARPKLRAILTDAQRDRLDELVAEKFAERSAERVRSTMAWAVDAFALEEARAARLERALLDHEERKRACFDALHDRPPGEPESDRAAFEDRMRELKEALDAALVDLLDEEQRERLSSRSSGRRWGKGRDLVE